MSQTIHDAIAKAARSVRTAAPDDAGTTPPTMTSPTMTQDRVAASSIDTAIIGAAKEIRKEKKPVREATFGDNLAAIGHSFLTGLSDVGYSLYAAADFILPDEAVSDLLGVENKVGKFFDWMKEGQKASHAHNAELNAKASPAVAAVNNYVVRPVANMLPAAALAVASGGASLAGDAGAAMLGTAGTASAATGTAAAVKTATTQLLKNPNFWLSFGQISGNTYSDALENGASEGQAVYTALTNGIAGSLIEMGGGIQKGGQGNWFVNTIEEVGEEVSQGWVENGISAVVYDQDKEWFSLTDSEAVFSATRAKDEAIGTVFAAGVMNAGQMGAVKVNQYVQASRIGSEYLNGTNGKTLQGAIEIGLANAPSMDAYKAAQKIQQKVDAGQEVSPYLVGRMVAESFSPEAKLARQLDALVANTGEALGVQSETIEAVAAVAVRTGRRVEFATPEQIAASNNVNVASGVGGLYNRDTNTIYVSSALSTDEAVDYVLKHEISHSIETTQAWSKMESLARQAMGEDAYAAAVRDMMAQRQAVGDTTGATETGAKKEVIADWVGKNLWKNNFAAIVAAKDKGLANKLALTMWNIRRGLSFTENGRQTARVKYAEQLLMKAIEDTARTDPALELNTPSDPSGGQYAIVETTDGRYVAVVDNDVLKGINLSTWDKKTREVVKKAASVELKKFSNGFYINGVEFIGNKDTRDEYTRANYSEALAKKNPTAFRDKMRAANVLDEVVRVATNWKNDGQLTHPRTDYVDFVRGKALLMSGSRKYSVTVLAGVTGTGNVIFHDIVDVQPDSFTIKKSKIPTADTAKNSPHAILGISDGFSLSQPIANVKKKDIFGFTIDENADVNEDLLEELATYHPDADVDAKGNITVFHRTTSENAAQIKRSGMMYAKEDAVFFSSKADGYATDYGDTVVKFKIPSTVLRLNDVFDGEVHFDVPAKYRNGRFFLDVSRYLVKENASSGQLSFLPPEMMESGKPDVYQEDGEREAYFAEDRRTDNPSVSHSADTSLYTREAEQNGAIDENGELDEDALNRMVEERKRTKAEAASLEANRALLAQYQNGEISEQTYLERVEDLRREAERAIDKKYRQGKRGSAEQKEAVKKLRNDVESGLEENYRLKEARLEAEHAERRERDRQRRESKERTEKRNQLNREIDSLQSRLLNPKDGRSVPKELVAPCTELLTALRENSDDTEKRLAELDEKIRKERDPDKHKRLLKRRDNLLERSKGLDTQLLRLKKLYAQYAQMDTIDGVPVESDAYAVVTKMIDLTINQVGDRSIKDLSIEELRAVLRTVQSVAHTSADANRLHSKHFKEGVHETGLQMEQEARNNKTLSGGWARAMLAMQLNPDRFFDAMGDFAKDSAWKALGMEFADGQTKVLEINRDFHTLFADIINDKAFKALASYKDTDLVDVGVVGIDGKPVKMTRGMMLALYQTITCPGNRQALIDGGIEIPNMKQYYEGKNVDAYAQGARISRSSYCEAIHDILHQREQVSEINEIDRLTRELVRLEEQASAEYDAIAAKIEEQMTDYERQYCELMREWFDNVSKNHINEVTMDVFGFQKAIVEKYFPIYRDTNFVANEIDGLVSDITLESLGSLKSRVRSRAPIKLADVTDVLMRNERSIANYCGYLRPMTDMKKLLNVHTQDMKHSVKDTLVKMTKQGKGVIGTTPMEYIKGLMVDIAGGRQNENSLFSALRRNVIRATMTFNPRVAVKQIGAVFTSAGELGWKYQSEAVQKVGRKLDPAMVAKYSVYFHERMYGSGGMEEFAAMKQGSNIFDRTYRKMDDATGGKLFNWCQDMDNYVCNLLWFGCEAKIRDTRPELKSDTEEFYEAVGKELDHVIQKTQTNYTLMERSDLQRDTRWTTKILSTYKTDAIQGFNMLFEANARYRRYKKDLAAGKGGVTQADVDAAKQQLADTIPAVLVGNVLWGAFAGILMNLLMQRTSGVRDDNDEITAASVGKALLSETLGGMAGLVVFGDQVYDIAAARIFGDNYYGISDMGVETLSGLLEDFATGNFTKGKTVKYLLQDMGKVVGIPLKNAWDIGEGFAKHIEDLSKGEFLSLNADADTTPTQYYRRLYKAMQKGDTEKADEIREFLVTCGKTEAEIQTGLRAAVKKTDKDFQKAYNAAMQEAMEDMFYRAMTEKERKKVASGISGYIADQIVADKSGGELTKANQKAAGYIDQGASVAEYFIANTAKNAEFADKNEDGKVSKAEYRGVMNDAEYDEYLKRLLLGLK